MEKDRRELRAGHCFSDIIHSSVMTLRHSLLLGLAATFASSCSTPLMRDDQSGVSKVVQEAFAPIYEASLLRSGAINILYCSASFRHKNDRWPKDYAELTAFVKQSDGYLVLGEYERIELRSLPDDSLELRYVRPGHTNEEKLTLGGSPAKK